MGSFFTKEKTETSLLVQDVSVSAAVKEEPVPSKPNSAKRDARTYKEVLRGGVEKGSMSKLRERGAKWEFCETPKNEKVQVQEHVPEPSRDREGAGYLPPV